MQLTVSCKTSRPCFFPLLISVLVLCISCSAIPGAAQAGPSNDSLSFIVLGDWGRDGEGHQEAVAAQVNFIGTKFNISFIVTTGDNFYDVGVRSIRDRQWKSSFELVYNRKRHQVPWYPTLGNHDYGTNPQAQVEYTAVSKRWRMPARYHSIEKKITGSDSALFVFTDTSPFVTAYHGQKMADLQQQDTAAQLKWFSETLTNSHHQWKIVVGHHPIFSSGPHGNTPELIQRFQPVLTQSGTDFYLCGHDHILEHIVHQQGGVQHLISGGGGAGLYALRDSPGSVFAKSSPGFLVITLYSARANVYFYNEKGHLLYWHQIVKQAT